MKSNPASVPHLLSIQSSVVQAGYAALEAELRHPIVDQQEVPQLGEKGTKNSAIREPKNSIQGRAALKSPRIAHHSPMSLDLGCQAFWGSRHEDSENS